MAYVVRYNKQIDWKRFQKLPMRDKKRLKDAIEQKLMIDPMHFGKPLRKSLFGCRSLRVGDCCIIYVIQGDSVEILLFGHRSIVYEDGKGIL